MSDHEHKFTAEEMRICCTVCHISPPEASLKSLLQEREKELAYWKQSYKEQFEKYSYEQLEANGRIATLEGALKKYGGHMDDCGIHGDSGNISHECSCGFDDVMDAARPEAGEKNA